MILHTLCSKQVLSQLGSYERSLPNFLVEEIAFSCGPSLASVKQLRYHYRTGYLGKVGGIPLLLSMQHALLVRFEAGLGGRGHSARARWRQKAHRKGQDLGLGKTNGTST